MSNINLPRYTSNFMVEPEDRIIELEHRISKLEKIVFSKTEKADWKSDNFKGLRGGLRLLIKNGFFDNPKKLTEIDEELKREGYHYPKPSISKALAVDLTNKQKLLNRIKGPEQWIYVLRK